FFAPVVVLSSGDHLVLTDAFPEIDRPGEGRPAHDAALAAQAAGRRPDVFRLAPVEATAYHEVEGVDCITGTEAALAALISGGRHRSVEVHASDPAARAILARHAEAVRTRT